MATDTNKIFSKMLERLYASLASGPVLNCRPHSSRQRVDLTTLGAIDPSGDLLPRLLGENREIKLAHKGDDPAVESLFRKLRMIAEDARTYEHDTGAHVLYVGYPLLSLPPDRTGRFRNTKRVLAPIAFIPVSLAVKVARPSSVVLECAGQGADLVIPNAALLAWTEQQTGKKLDDLFADEAGEEPWREIRELVEKVCTALEIEAPSDLAPPADLVTIPTVEETDGKEPRVLRSAVLGLYPVTNQSLLRDVEALAGGEAFTGPLESFLKVGVGLGHDKARAIRDISSERLVTFADPCQARAVRLAKVSRGLVIHGPPGTGKSQTIANVIGDHVARGERVLFVCEKRTALDVVLHRLGRLGLGQLCAIVHDAQRDQRELYKSIREQLDALSEAKTNPTAVADLKAVDAELGKIHRELTEHHAAIAKRAAETGDRSLHELAGEWFSLAVPKELAAVREIPGTSPSDLVPLERDAREVLERSAANGFPNDPWCEALGLELKSWLARPVDQWREQMDAMHRGARTVDENANPAILPLQTASEEEGRRRMELAEKLAPIAERLGSAAVVHWSTQSKKALRTATEACADVAPHVGALRDEKPDRELALAARSQKLGVADLVLFLGKLASYLAIARKWYGFIFFGRKRQALEVLQRFGLALAADSAERASKFIEKERARLVLADLFESTLAPGRKASEVEDIAQTVSDYAELLAILASIDDPQIQKRLADAGAHEALFEGLRASQARAAAIRACLAAVESSGLVSAKWCDHLRSALLKGESALSFVTPLQQSFSHVEGLLRIQKSLAALPAPVAGALKRLAERGASSDDGWHAIKKAVIASEILRRMEKEPCLHDMDADRLRASHERYRALDARKRQLVVESIHHVWTSKQRERLLAMTGSRLNSAGAELKRRLTLRGERAMRLRQVVASGAEAEGGDPLFEMRPVWMASPETVAQIFPRKAIFDVVIFDEASQCKLEEALPVLTRARRVVIAGDPKQLPPTRFFESSIAQSHDDDGDGSEQSLFEEQQSDVEDLLTASLNLEIEQCYLDVHYRSQNSDLIEFSNQNFYDARLQPIPGHPKNRAFTPPLRLVRVAGVLEKRANVVEAKEVVRLVRELLARKNPPSIGVACFNLTQRDVIIDALDDAAAKDPEFAGKLAAARSRQGAGSFEGLFVKNLENVQGDERDHMIISTTYAPDAQGRFYRRFGPLAQAGGGRRLNVLVTRARQEVHLVTSIPREVYASLQPVEAGRTPNGGWLLFSYLQYAEKLEEIYEAERRRLASAKVVEKGTVHVHRSSTPSLLAEALAKHLSDTRGTSSDVHWGNDGFCVDVALAHPTRPEDVTIGVLCDGARYDKAEDPIEWDLFRTAILESQGWKFVRLWTPQFFRDPDKAMHDIQKASEAMVGPPPSPTTSDASLN